VVDKLEDEMVDKLLEDVVDKLDEDVVDTLDVDVVDKVDEVVLCVEVLIEDVESEELDVRLEVELDELF
jgi:hypothetical protein